MCAVAQSAVNDLVPRDDPADLVGAKQRPVGCRTGAEEWLTMKTLTFIDQVFALCQAKGLTYREAVLELGRRGRLVRAANRNRLRSQCEGKRRPQ